METGINLGVHGHVAYTDSQLAIIWVTRVWLGALDGQRKPNVSVRSGMERIGGAGLGLEAARTRV